MVPPSTKIKRVVIKFESGFDFRVSSFGGISGKRLIIYSEYGADAGTLITGSNWKEFFTERKKWVCAYGKR